MQKFWKGMIVEQGIENPEILKSFWGIKVKNVLETGLTIHLVQLTPDQIKFIRLKTGPWFAHFWNETTLTVLFKEKHFELPLKSKQDWRPALDFGRELGISNFQLDFAFN